MPADAADASHPKRALPVFGVQILNPLPLQGSGLHVSLVLESLQPDAGEYSQMPSKEELRRFADQVLRAIQSRPDRGRQSHNEPPPVGGTPHAFGGSVSLDLIRELTPAGFEGFVGELFKARGYEVTVTRHRKDGGIDLVLARDGWTWIGQCKHFPPDSGRPRGGAVGGPAVQQLLGAVYHERVSGGILITSGYFSKQARRYAESSPTLRLVDGLRLLRCAKNPDFPLW